MVSEPLRPGPPETPAGGAVACDCCGAPMEERQCKIVCPRCGFRRDCTDP
jgi:Zn finger protein HypA/HybF involved in hydrogenase expression